MEKKNSYAKYSDVRAFLEMHSNEYAVEDVMKAAGSYLAVKGCIQNEKKNIFDGVDVTRLDDSTFESMLDELPIRMNRSFYDNIDDIDNLIPELYKCYVMRILNLIPEKTHRHEFMEVVYVWKGSCELTCEGIMYSLFQGDFLFIAPKKKHSIHIEDNNSIIFNINISRNTFDQLLLGILSLDHAVSYYIKNTMFGGNKKGAMKVDNLGEPGEYQVRQIIKLIVGECYSENMEHLLMFDALVMQLLCVIIKYSGKLNLTNGEMDEGVIGPVLNYIQDNFTSITMQSLADHFGYSEAHMCRMIKQATRKTFSEMVRSIRVETAKQIMINSSLNVRRVGELVGYNNTSVFVRAFQKETGMSPSEFLLRNQNL